VGFGGADAGVARALLARVIMMRSVLSLLVLISTCLLPACVLSHSSDDDGGEACPALAAILVDPTTNTCQAYAPPCGSNIADVSRAPCHTTCDDLGEADCLGDRDTGCRATYVFEPDTGSGSLFHFDHCWTTLQQPTATGKCSGLDAESCSSRSDCIAQYVRGSDNNESFMSCGTLTGQSGAR
jgi:hypothetical protein